MVLSERLVLRPAAEHLECTMMGLNDRNELNMFNVQSVRDAYFESQESYRHAVMMKRQTLALYLSDQENRIGECRSELRKAYDRLNKSARSFRTISKQAKIRIQNARRDALSATIQAAEYAAEVSENARIFVAMNFESVPSSSTTRDARRFDSMTRDLKTEISEVIGDGS